MLSALAFVVCHWELINETMQNKLEESSMAVPGADEGITNGFWSTVDRLDFIIIHWYIGFS